MIATPANGLFTCHAKFPEFQIVGIQAYNGTPQGVLMVRCQNPGCLLHKGMADVEQVIAQKWNTTVPVVAMLERWERFKKGSG